MGKAGKELLTKLFLFSTKKENTPNIYMLFCDSRHICGICMPYSIERSKDAIHTAKPNQTSDIKHQKTFPTGNFRKHNRISIYRPKKMDACVQFLHI